MVYRERDRDTEKREGGRGGRRAGEGGESECEIGEGRIHA